MSKQLDQLAFSFFKLFAQYESNLKEKGFFQANGKKINVDWDRFANEVIGNSFLEDLGDKAQYAEFILSEPPKRQVLQNYLMQIQKDRLQMKTIK